MKIKSRFIVYHAHYTKIIGVADTIEQALHIGEQFGCKDHDCPCQKYYVYDRKIKTNDITKIVEERMKEETYQFYRKTGRWKKRGRKLC